MSGKRQQIEQKIMIRMQKVSHYLIGYTVIVVICLHIYNTGFHRKINTRLSRDT